MTKIKVSKLAEEFNMDSKAVVLALNAANIKAVRSNSSVDEEAACAALGTNTGGAEVVSLDAARDKRAKPAAKKSGPTSAERKLAEFYKKYPHVIAGSVRDLTAEDKKDLMAKSHGKVCTIKCVDTGEMRTINTQDAFQTKRTPDAQQKYLRRRRAERRADKKAQAQNG